MRRILIVVAVAAVLFSGCAGESPEVPLGPDGEPDTELSLGRDVYSRRCANCHGAGGGGGTGPKLSEGAVVEAYRDPGEQRELIANGRNAMPSFSGSPGSPSWASAPTACSASVSSWPCSRS